MTPLHRPWVFVKTIDVGRPQALSPRCYLAVDTSYERGIVVLFDETGVLHEQFLGVKFEHGQAITDAVKTALDIASLKRLELSSLFCGLGPGSFVGVRIALATMLGFSWAREIPLMGFCSHLALALSLKKNISPMRIFMKASGHLGYACRYHHAKDGLMPRSGIEVMGLSDFIDGTDVGEMVLSDQADEMDGLVKNGCNVAKIAGASASGVMRAVWHRVRGLGQMVDERDLIRPNYIKPPNVSKPKGSILLNHPHH